MKLKEIFEGLERYLPSHEKGFIVGNSQAKSSIWTLL